MTDPAPSSATGTDSPRPFADCSQAYLAWMGAHPPLLEAELADRASKIAQDPFMFLRGTFYRWAETFPLLCPQSVDAPTVLGVGDVHVENFGTWPVPDGIAWGVNDFDEATRLPYTNDLVRLVTSALVADPALVAGQVAAWVSAGYRQALTGSAAPYLLSPGGPPVMLASYQQGLHSAKHFDAGLEGLPPLVVGDPRLVPEAVAFLQSTAGTSASPSPVRNRDAGCGSLGRVRLTAYPVPVASTACEVKRLLPSAWVWARAGSPDTTADPSEGNPSYAELVTALTGVVDPSITVDPTHRWVARTLDPSRSRVELIQASSGATIRFPDPGTLLTAMGAALAAVHRADPGVDAVRAHLPLDLAWLAGAAATMAASTVADHASLTTTTPA